MPPSLSHSISPHTSASTQEKNHSSVRSVAGLQDLSVISNLTWGFTLGTCSNALSVIILQFTPVNSPHTWEDIQMRNLISVSCVSTEQLVCIPWNGTSRSNTHSKPLLTSPAGSWSFLCNKVLSTVLKLCPIPVFNIVYWIILLSAMFYKASFHVKVLTFKIKDMLGFLRYDCMI